MFNRMAVAALVLSLCACGAPRPRPSAPQSPLRTGAALQALPTPGTYEIDSHSSELVLLVYRAGPLANLGHNHVMVSNAVTGAVKIGATLSSSSFSLAVPADSLVVDDPQARRAAGEDFPGEVPEDAKSGTRRNMLSAAVLNAAEFPTITVTSVSLAGTPDALSAELTISIAGRKAHISASCTLQGDAHTLTAVGSMELRQTAIGMTPYSLLHGALQVQDAMQLRYSIVVPLS
jgi:polyisoprenoid-binding protein YceI